MTNDMRQKLAREPFEEKIRKVSQLIHLAKKVAPQAKSHNVKSFITGPPDISTNPKMMKGFGK